MYNDEKTFKKRVNKIIEKYILECLYTEMGSHNHASMNYSENSFCKDTDIFIKKYRA